MTREMISCKKREVSGTSASDIFWGFVEEHTGVSVGKMIAFQRGVRETFT